MISGFSVSRFRSKRESQERNSRFPKKMSRQLLAEDILLPPNI